MDNRTWKVGIVGCGKIAGGWDSPRLDGPIVTHAQAYHRHPKFHLAAAVDPDIRSLGRFERTWSVPQTFGSIEEMQDSGPFDVISICSPDQFHYSQAVSLLTSGLSPAVLLVEKPICSEPEELSSLIDLTKQTEVSIVVNHTRRFDPAHQCVARLAKSGELGPLIDGRCTYYGGWLHNGTHIVDTLRMMFDREPRVVSAQVSGDGRQGDRNLNVRLGLGDSTVSIEAFDESYYQLSEWEFRFEAGRIRLLDFGNTIAVEKVMVNELEERVLAPHEQSPCQGLISPIFHALEAVDAQLQGNSIFKDLGVDLAGAAGTMAVMWEARQLAMDSQISTPQGAKE